MLCEKFADEDVEITCDKPSQSLILKGSSFAVKQAKQEASKQIKVNCIHLVCNSAC